MTIPQERIDLPASPQVLGLEPFPDWREGQRELTERILDWYYDAGAPRFMLLEAPTGIGKSLVAAAVHRYLAKEEFNYHGLITTSTLSLQEQYMEDTLGPVLARSAWGRSNHDCLIATVKVDEAACTHGYKCPEKVNCTYYVERDAAHEAEIAVLNTAYYLTSVNHARVGKFVPNARHSTFLFENSDLAIYDEAHLLEKAVQSAAEERLYRGSFAQLGISLPDTHAWGTWSDWIERNIFSVQQRAATYTLEARRLAHIGEVPKDRTGRRAVAALRSMLRLQRELLPTRPLVEIDPLGVRFRAAWGKYFTPGYLFPHARKHLLMSATIIHPAYVAETLGITDYTFVQIPSPFSPMRRRIVYDPVLKVTGKTTREEFRQLVVRMDEHLDKHAGQKGIIHSVSYDRAEQILQHSRHRQRMITHVRGKGLKEAAIESYLESEDGILVSPAVGVGEDFGRGENCRFQVFVKYPIPYLGDPVTRARAEERSDSLWMEADMAFVQAVGRGMRSADDWVTNYLLDAGAGWRLRFLPGYVQDSLIVPS
jgi:ATP-dependent DNA helicase DinG